eukprot:CAMPEP_0170140118 /NCGR_PEP_ID=MMETSP0033_2-20121228/6147_1 /TAXON_ID=195969 /ORGANISM="Dolichomastix tenuilepis, Strain CCMP3274" /LENGTH=656 /DNA_ID=CAMNT_0010376309 /DNA_START=102 /DNA_END=2072 /DNA_ORIENTATION=-
MAAQSQAAALLLAFAFLSSATAVRYCQPGEECWPATESWEELSEQLGGKLEELGGSESDLYEECFEAESDAYSIASHPQCMQTHNCAREFCDSRLGWNLPAYVARAETVADVRAALAFASTHNIAVTIKTSGHSYAGSSTGRGTLLVWMAHFETPGPGGTALVLGPGEWTDSCAAAAAAEEEEAGAVLKVGGGQTWKEAYAAAFEKGYHLVGGGGLTVSAAGGWLMGGGLSSSSRKYGLGIDNVVQIEVVLASGDLVVADACTEPDLFWALRGGGGGTFGVVTAAYYRLHEIEPVHNLQMWILPGGTPSSESCVDDDSALALAILTDGDPANDYIQTCLIGGLSGLCTFFEQGVREWFQNLCPVTCITGCAEGLDSETWSAVRGAWTDWWVDNAPDINRNWSGYWTLTTLDLNHMGSSTPSDGFGSELEASLQAWKHALPASQRSRVHISSRTESSYWQLRGQGASTDATGSMELPIASRLVTRTWVVDNPELAKAALRALVADEANGGVVTSYLLGGAVADVSANATAISPAMRDALWSVHLYHLDPTNDAYAQNFRDAVTDGSGACYNHASYIEPDWERSFWGDNLERLQELKLRYDPNKRFNCWHCVGWEEPAPAPAPEEEDETTEEDTTEDLSSASSKATLLLCATVALAVL